MAKEPQKGSPARLEDVLNYEAETYFSKDEMTLIRTTFRDPRVLKVVRKALMPSVGDREMPIEDLGSDLWLMGRDYGSIPDAEIKSIVLARQDAIKFIMGGLIKLKVMANSKEETSAEAMLRRGKDSLK